MPRTRTPRSPITREMLIQVVLDGLAHAGERHGRQYGSAFTAATVAAALDGSAVPGPPAPPTIIPTTAPIQASWRPHGYEVLVTSSKIRSCVRCEREIVDPEEVPPGTEILCRWCADIDDTSAFAPCQDCRRSIDACLRKGEPCCEACSATNTHPRLPKVIDSPFAENGDWWTCPLHGGAITQDCSCSPVLARQEVAEALSYYAGQKLVAQRGDIADKLMALAEKYVSGNLTGTGLQVQVVDLAAELGKGTR